MTITDFPETDQNIILSRLNLEKGEWDRKNKIDLYFQESRGDKQSKFILECFEKFTKFYSQVTKNEDIEEAFFAWSGQDLILPDLNRINAPQYGFFEMYRDIKRAFGMKQLEIN